MNIPPLGSLVEYNGRVGYVQAVKADSQDDVVYRIVDLMDPGVVICPLYWSNVRLLCGPMASRETDGPQGSMYQRHPMSEPSLATIPRAWVRSPTTGGHVAVASLAGGPYAPDTRRTADGNSLAVDSIPTDGGLVLSNNGFFMLAVVMPYGGSPRLQWTSAHSLRGGTAGAVSPNYLTKVRMPVESVFYLTEWSNPRIRRE